MSTFILRRCSSTVLQLFTGVQRRHFSSSLALHEKKLFTPGPLGVSLTTRQAMLKDLGSRDVEFMATVKYLRERIVQIADVPADQYTCIPVQGSGTFAVEAVFQTSVPRNNGRVLILANGAYGKRMAKICEVIGIEHHIELFPENEKVSPKKVRQILNKDKNFTNVAIVHCETSSGVINPVEEIGLIVKLNIPACAYFVDAMSSFGAIPLDMQQAGVDYIVSSANKCLEGVPGFSYAIARKEHLIKCKGQSRSLTLDLVDQYQGLESTGQFRFTPPTHTMLALKQALLELDQEGGVQGRAKRYQNNREILREGMKKLGFREFLDDSHKGYIITSYCFPADPNFSFSEFYKRLNEKDQVIYPGKVLDADCFRIGNIGHLYPDDMCHLLTCIEQVCQDMKISLPIPS